MIRLKWFTSDLIRFAANCSNDSHEAPWKMAIRSLLRAGWEELVWNSRRTFHPWVRGSKCGSLWTAPTCTGLMKIAGRFAKFRTSYRSECPPALYYAAKSWYHRWRAWWKCQFSPPCWIPPTILASIDREVEGSHVWKIDGTETVFVSWANIQSLLIRLPATTGCGSSVGPPLSAAADALRRPLTRCS